ncbi:hypothetical protein, partial [Galliscardovia ingluviei]|uniref:hypothetical protein n=1 Tax=Galliscardovia ingluviei TaxID=1769422 RepID=UPI001E2F7AD1
WKPRPGTAMVLHSVGCGRVAHRHGHTLKEKPPIEVAFLHSNTSVRDSSSCTNHTHPQHDKGL